MTVRPFAVDVPEAVLDDLRDRLSRTRFLDDSPRRPPSGMTSEYLQTLARLWMDAGTSVLSRAATVTAPPRPPTSTPAPSPSPAALVLEAEAGELAQGVIMVENRLARRVSATVVTSAFSNAAGEEIWPTLRVHPGTIDLEPGARTLVQIGALVDDRLDPATRYQGQVTVPGLSDTPIPIVLQRRPAATPPAATEPVAPEAKPKRPRRSGAAAKRRRKS